jgi:putative ABC transport system permease protein
MNIFFRVFGIIILAVQHLWTQRGLALATSLGIVSAVALSMSIPLYSDAAYEYLYQKKIFEEPEPGYQMSRRPPFAFMFRYIGAWDGPVSWEKLQPVDSYLSERALDDLKLPLNLFVKYLKTDNLRLYPANTQNYDETSTPLAWVNFAAASNISDHITITEGENTVRTLPDSEGLIRVVVSEKLANDSGIQIGEIFTVFGETSGAQGTIRAQYLIQVSGIFAPTDTEEDYWFYNPTEMDSILLVSETTLLNRVIPYLQEQIYLALWYYVFDGASINSEDVPALLSRIAAVRQSATNLLPNTRLDISPEDSLIAFRSSANSLTIFLTVFSVPLLALNFIFIWLMGKMSVSERQNEIAVLRSRGATKGQLLGIVGLEGFILGVIGMIIGAPLATEVTEFLGRARSFLDFTANLQLQVSVTNRALMYGLIASVFSFIAQVLPAWDAARHTIVTYKQERARSIKPSWWQRNYLDFILLALVFYGGYLLYTRGRENNTIVESLATGDPFTSPMLFLVPAMGIFAFTLVLIRIVPLFMTLINKILVHTNSISLLMAARQLARTPGIFNTPLILLVVTLSLSTFTATLAQTLDKHLFDQAYYANGTDVRAFEFGDQPGGSMSGYGFSPENEGQITEGESNSWVFLPVSEHLKVNGIVAATRVGLAPASIRVGSGTVDGDFLGLDRIDFPLVAFWRSDFAQESLGALMNNLALTSDGVLIPESFLSANSLRLGDTVYITVAPLGEKREIATKVVGVFEYFPTWYPEQGPLIVGNLHYLYESVGGEFPYHVWLKTLPGVDYAQMELDVRQIFRRLISWDVAEFRVASEQGKPERQGVFGLLSIGFIALDFLTILGFLLYSIYSFRNRFIELGVLRAIGLTRNHMFTFLAAELIFVLCVGIGAGTGLGVWISNQFIPYLQVGSGQSVITPPFFVEIDWVSVFQTYILFGFLFLISLLLLIALLLRMKIFQAVKMGETV